MYPFKGGTGEINLWAFYCPGCRYDHALAVRQYIVGGNPQWDFNSDVERPTFSPSLLVFGSDPSKRCHSCIRDGKIEFLGDCFHELKGQTVEIPDYEI